MAASTCSADSALDLVKLMEENIGFKSSALLILKVDLRFLRTFVRFAGKWSGNKYFHASDDDDVINLASFLLSVDDAVHQNVQIMKALPLGILDDGNGMIPQSHFNQVFSKFHQTIESFSEEINGFCVVLLERSSKFRAPLIRDELVGFLDSVLDNIRDVRSYDMNEVSEDLEEKVGFLQNMIRFAGMRGVEDKQLEDLMFHTEAVAVNLAHLYYAYAYVGVEGMDFKVSDLLHKIKPVQSQVRDIYTRVLGISKLSGSRSSKFQSLKFDERIWGDFIDSVRGNLWEFLCSGFDFLVSVKDHVQLLYEGLSFLRSILREQHKKLDDLHEKTRTLVGDIVIEAGIISCSLFAVELEEVSAKDISLALSDLMKKMKFVKSRIAEKYPSTTRLNYPRTNVLGFINLLLEDLDELQSSEAPSIVFAKDQIQTVHEDLIFIRSFVEGIVDKCDEHEEVQTLCSQAMDVVYKVEFFIDSLVINHHLHCCPMLLNNITEEINVLKFKASKIDDNTKMNEFGEGKISNKASNYVESQVSTPIINEAVVGFKDEADKLNNLLTRGTSELDVVSIVGMPGLGKTTVAKKLYNDRSVTYHFHIRAWSCVSQLYNKHRLLLDILEKIFVTLPPHFAEMDEDDLFEKLYKSLKGKRYLIVLDDVWEIAVWNDFGRLFPNDSNGSRILLTTRLQDVASNANGKLHFLRALTDDECLDLLRKKLSREEDCPPPRISELGVQIAKVCKGLPFSIVVVAGILAAMEQQRWVEVVESLSSNTLYGTEQCMSTLELSYNHLPNYLKPCLLYLGLFPEDQEVPFSKLMWLWIAEGFVLKSDSKSLEEVAGEYMMDLRGRSLIMVGQQSSLGTNTIKSCHIHDLVHEFCMAKAYEENFAQLLRLPGELSAFYEPHGLRRLCILSEPEHLRKSRLFCPHIHSLSFFNMDKYWHARDPSNVSFLFHFSKLLRVLNLEKIKLGDVFPAEIELLVQLRYLAICGDMYFIPSSISTLKNLETFFVEGFSDDILLPDAIWDMKKLRHLHLSKSVVLSLPNDSVEKSKSGCLYNLDTFSTASIGPETEQIMFHLFPNVRKLKCRLSESWDCGGILELGSLSRLESLRMFPTGVIPDEFEFIFPENLKKLTLSEFLLPWSEISVIGKLPNLEVLKLLSGAFRGETWDMDEEEEEGGEGEEFFPKLKFLKLEFLDLVNWTTSSDDFLPRLQKLVIRNCWKLEEIPTTLGDISTLTMIEVYRCQSSLASLVKQIQEEQVDMGNEVLNILIHASGWTDED